MAATVTIDKTYFETLLRRAEFHINGRDLSTPVDIPTVSIPKIDHDNLLRMAQEYTCLRESLYNGGIEPETLEILIRGGSVEQIARVDTFVDDDDDGDGLRTRAASAFTPPSKTRVVMSRPSDFLWSNAGTDWTSKDAGNGFEGNSKAKPGHSSRHNSYTQDDDVSWDPELDKEDAYLAVPRPEKKRYAREEQRTILAKNLSDRATHRDIIDFVRGGLVLDIYLRSAERIASISFVEGSAAQDFMNHVKRNDVYMHGKRLEFVWNDRQFILPGHVANKIGIGATRNLIIRNVHPNITEERIREDLDHIHNLVVVDISFQNGDVYLQLNSIHNALFARTCMMSRVTYKGMRIEWYSDDCSQPLPKTQPVSKKENTAPRPSKGVSATKNRFQMLNLEGDGTEDGSEEEGHEAIVLSDISSMRINHRSPWSLPTIAA